MTPDLAIGHALGALVLDVAKGMAAVAVAMACVFFLGLGRGFYCEHRAQRRADHGEQLSLWERNRNQDDLWRRGNGGDY